VFPFPGRSSRSLIFAAGDRRFPLADGVLFLRFVYRGPPFAQQSVAHALFCLVRTFFTRRHAACRLSFSGLTFYRRYSPFFRAFSLPGVAPCASSFNCALLLLLRDGCLLSTFSPPASFFPDLLLLTFSNAFSSHEKDPADISPAPGRPSFSFFFSQDARDQSTQPSTFPALGPAFTRLS